MLSELENYLLRIEDLRGQISSLIADLPAKALNWRPTEAGDDHITNSLAAMTTHVAGAEHFWIGEVIGGLARTRDREAEFVVEVTDAAGLQQRLVEVGKQTRRVCAGLSDSDLGDTRQRDDRTITVRWGMLHVVDHTALHLGHMQITYQLWHGGQGVQAPRWYQRLPGE
ncbi:MAG: DUF664 domain-containing protein [Anaerolineae bacterium]|nr:DUF664 domain-containing protein [Anaerolineae bacterium]